MFLGHQPNHRGVIDRARLFQETQDLLVQLALIKKIMPPDILATDIIGDLSVGKQQLVEIAKALRRIAEF